MRKLGVLLVATGALCAGLLPAARANHKLLHSQPQKAAPAAFPDGFDAPLDTEWKDWRLGGFGGTCATPEVDAAHEPVIFVHGNVVDAADWYPVQDAFRAAGWGDCDLWAVSYNGMGNNSGSAGGTTNPRRDTEHTEHGSDGVPHSTDNATNVADLDAFIREVLRHTGAERFSLVTHSLGVTLARATLEGHADLAGRLGSFVGIAGGNHGTSLCPPGSETAVVSCDELAAGSDFLAQLNAPPDEFGTAPVMTVYDGSGVADSAYLGTYAQSPRLADVHPAALDCAYPGRGHNDLRLSAGIVANYRSFIEAAEQDVAGSCGADPLGLS